MHEITNINGATFVFSPFENIETASFGVFIKVGSRFEASKLRGISHFLEHMVFKGSKNYSYREIKREIEGRGGALNGFTSQETTAYYAHFLNKNTSLTMDILLDMVFSPTLGANDINKERNVILEEIKMYNDLPSSRATSILDKLIWPRHSLGEEIIGDFSTVSSINRKDLMDFNNLYYSPSNIVISCSGNFDQKKIIGLLKERISKSNNSIKPSYILPKALKGLHIKTEKKKIEQTHLCIGFRSISYSNPRRFVAEVLNVILGANMSSRLFEEVREKRALCYEISTDARKYKDSGAFVIHVGLNKHKVRIALSSILKELKKIKDGKVSEKELTRAKDYMLGQLVMSLERPQGRMFYLAENYISTGRIYSLQEIKEEIQNIKADDVRKLAGDIFDFNNMCVSLVGDVNQEAENLIREVVCG